jgi:hypothetical protein
MQNFVIKSESELDSFFESCAKNNTNYIGHPLKQVHVDLSERGDQSEAFLIELL